MPHTFFTEEDPHRFAARVHDFLVTDPIANTLPITVLDAVVRGEYPEYVLGAVEDDGAIMACAVQTVPRDVIVAADTDIAAAKLAHGLRARGRRLPGVTGTYPAAQAFAAAWCRDSATTATARRAERLFRLDTLVVPSRVPGGARRASSCHQHQLAAWTQAFADEIGGFAPTDLETAVAIRIDGGRAWVWEAEGRPLSYAAHSPLLAGHARIGPVFTPREHRGAGYASNLVAHVSARLMTDGVVPALFTDLANPTSNAIYQTLGYRPVADAVEIAFT